MLASALFMRLSCVRNVVVIAQSNLSTPPKLKVSREV